MQGHSLCVSERICIVPCMGVGEAAAHRSPTAFSKSVLSVSSFLQRNRGLMLPDLSYSKAAQNARWVMCQYVRACTCRCLYVQV